MNIGAFMAGRLMRPVHPGLKKYSVQLGSTIEIIMQLDDRSVLEHFQLDVEYRSKRLLLVTGSRPALLYFAQALDDLQDQTPAWQRSAAKAAAKIRAAVGE